MGIIGQRFFKLQRVEILRAALSVCLHAVRVERDRLRQRIDCLAEAQLPAERVGQLQKRFIRLRLCAAGADLVRVGKPVRQIPKLTFVRSVDVGKVFSHLKPPRSFLFLRQTRD